MPFSNLRSPYILYKNNFPTADKDGIWKVEYESNGPILIHFLSRLLADNNFYFLAEKGYDYTISKDEWNPVHRLQNDSIFINEFDVLNHLHQHFGIADGPEISRDDVTYWQKGVIKYNTDGESDTAWKTHSKKFNEINSVIWDFSKPVKTEDDFFKKCDEIFRYRNYVLDSTFQQKLISQKFYNYFKLYFNVWHKYNKFNIIPSRHLRENLNIPLSLDTNFTTKTRQLLKENEAEIVKLFKCDECINISGFSMLIEDFFHKKLYNESKYRTIMEEIFDTVLNSNQFSQPVKDMFLYTLLHHNKAIKNKVKNYPVILNKYYKNCKNQYYVNLLKSEIKEKSYFLSSEILLTTYLIDDLGQKTNLSDLLKKYRGKYVYIDLWGVDYVASTNQLENAKKLYEITKEKDFTVIFLGIDNNIKFWKENKAKFNLPANNSYYLENGFNSPLTKTLQINYLQRYLIFDKEGKLIEANATWPDDMLGKKYYEE